MKKSSQHLGESEILNDSIAYVHSLFIRDDEIQLFHGLQFIKETVEEVTKLAVVSGLSEDDREILLLAAWFYFSGFPETPKKFAKKSVEIVQDFLTEKEFSKSKIQSVVHLLVEAPSNQSSILSQILHDAHVSYKGRKGFFRKTEILRAEREILFNRKYSDFNWEKLIYKNLIKCNYLSIAARKIYQERKLKNIRKQRDRINKARKTTTRKKTGKEFGRAIDTLYRANYNNHISLSSIADGKANMMISINTIILSIIITFSGAGFTFSGSFAVDHIRFTVPIFVLLSGCLTSVVFAILSARPKVTSKGVDMKAVEKNRSSLLFFGNFVHVSLDQFVDHLSKLKKNQQDLYDSMSVDTYYLGVVLQKKYKLLSWSYSVFMFSLILCVVSFSVIFFYTNY
ncbi:MAG: Pycsar system effector family protein [Cyclobacteriaceae bacterium]